MIHSKCDMSINIDPMDQVIVRNLNLGDNCQEAFSEEDQVMVSNKFVEMGGGLLLQLGS